MTIRRLRQTSRRKRPGCCRFYVDSSLCFVGNTNGPNKFEVIVEMTLVQWTDKEKLHPDRGGIALQVHGGRDFTK